MIRVVNETRQSLLALEAALADTSSKRRTGLLHHEELPQGHGLVIVPCAGIHTFGMKFPIDAVFYNRRNQVTKVLHSMPRGRLTFSLTSRGVIELPAGTAGKTGTQPGDQLRFQQHPG